MVYAGRRLYLALVLLLGLPACASAQGAGLFIRPVCTVITAPVTGQTWCFDSTAQQMKMWDGATYVVKGGGGGTIAGSIATGQVGYGAAANTLAGSANLTWDNSALLGKVQGSVGIKGPKPFIDPIALGATCDGTGTGDVAAFTAAATFAMAQTKGATILIPPGTCVLPDGGVLTVPNVFTPGDAATIAIKGSGRGSSTIKTTTPGAVAITIKGQAPVSISDLTIINATGGTGIILTTTNDDNATAANTFSSFSNLWISGGAYGIHQKRAINAFGTQLVFASQTTAAVWVENLITADQGGIFLSNSWLQGQAGATGILATSGLVSMVNSVIIAFDVGVHIKPTGPDSISEVMIANSHITPILGGSTAVWVEITSTQSVGTLLFANNTLWGDKYGYRIDGVGAGDALIGVVTGGNVRVGITIAGTPATSGACVYMRKGQYWRFSDVFCDTSSNAPFSIVDSAAPAAFSVFSGIQSTGTTSTTPYAGSAYQVLDPYPALPFAKLPTVDDGSRIFCSDCTTASPCAGSGTSAQALRLLGAWSCGGAGGVASVTGTANQITVTGTTNPVLSIPDTWGKTTLDIGAKSAVLSATGNTQNMVVAKRFSSTTGGNFFVGQNESATPIFVVNDAAAITSGSYAATVIPGQYGGTGVANTGKSITLGGSLTTSGAFDTTFTMSGATAVTFPTSGTLLTSAGAVTSLAGTANQITASASVGAVTLSIPDTWGKTTLDINAKSLLLTGTANNQNLSTMRRFTDSAPTGNFEVYQNAAAANVWVTDITGTVITGTWAASVIAGLYGGTGVANSGKTITLGGNLTTSGANAVTFTTAGSTNVTLPTSGTLLTSAGAVTSATGTAGQIAVSGSVGAVTFSWPQFVVVTNSGGITHSGLTQAAAGSINMSGYQVSNTTGCTGGPTAAIAGISTTCTSDERQKDITGPFTRGLDDLLKIRPIRFHWNALQPSEDPTIERAGFGAQNVHAAIPEAAWLVKQADGQAWYTVSDRVILGTTINAIRELAERVQRLEARP